MTPAAQIAPARTLGLSTNFRRVPVARWSLWDAALPTSGRAPGGVPLTRLPCSPAPPWEDAREDADTREGSAHVGDPAATDQRVPGMPLEGRGLRRGVGPVASVVRPSVPVPALRTAAAPRGALPSRSARRDPHYCFRRRRSADGTALRPAPAACATPSCPRGERQGQPTVPGSHVPAPPRGVQRPSDRPRPPRGSARTPCLRSVHLAPLRVAHMDPSGPPPSSPCKLQPLAGCRSEPTGSAGGGGRRKVHTHLRDCLETRSPNHLLSLNSGRLLVDFQSEIKVDNSGIWI